MTTGQILRANSSNQSAWSTATYPDTAGTSGNVLTSDGTNWVSSTAPGGGLITVTGSLTNAQIKALHGTPIQIVAAPGAGKVLMWVSSASKLVYGGTNVFTAGGGAKISLYYGAGTTSTTIDVTTNATIISSASGYSIIGVFAAASSNFAATALENTAFYLYNPSVTEIAGNAANNNTITWSLTYYVMTI